MDISFQISKLSQKIISLSETLESLYPKQSMSNLRETISPVSSNLSVCSRLESQSGRIFSISWAGHGSSRNPEGSLMLASVTDEGEVTIWNTLKQKPMFRSNIISEDPWLMCCSFEHTESALLATGGAEGKLHLFRIAKTSSNEVAFSEHPLISLQAHDSYVSKCEFLTCIDMLSSSGDSTVKLWAIQPSQEPVRTFRGHVDDIMSLATTLLNPSIFLSGGCDSTTRLWDVRVAKGNVHTYVAHVGHINSVKFLKDSENSFGTGNSDGTCRLYDVRTLRELGTYARIGREECGVTDICFSNSGRLLMAADESGRVNVWDVFDERVPVQILNAHYEKINCIEVNMTGDRVATASTDFTIAFIKNDYEE